MILVTFTTFTCSQYKVRKNMKINPSDKKIEEKPNILKSKRRVLKGLFHEEEENVYSERVLRRICQIISEYFDENEITDVLTDLDIDQGNFTFYTGLKQSLFEFLVEIKNGRVELDVGERLNERHISRIVESFFDTLLWDDDSEHAVFLEKIKKTLSKTKLSIENHENKEYLIMDEAGWRNWQSALLQIHQQEAYELERYQNQYGDDKDIERKSLKGREGEISNLMEWHKCYMTVLEVFCQNIYKPTPDLNKAYLYLRDLIRKGVFELNLQFLSCEPYVPFSGDLFSAEKDWNENKKTLLTWDALRPELNAFHGRLFYLLQHSRTVIGDQAVEAVLPQILSIIEKNKKLVAEQMNQVSNEYYVTRKGDTFYYSGRNLKLKLSVDYVRDFVVLFDLNPTGGFCTYNEYEKAFKKKYPKIHDREVSNFRKWSQRNLTEKSKGVLSKTHSELIQTRDGDGFEFHNRKS